MEVLAFLAGLVLRLLFVSANRPPRWERTGGVGWASRGSINANAAVPHVLIGNTPLELASMVLNVFFLGVPKAGKSVLMTILRRSRASLMNSDKSREIMLDEKNELLPVLSQLYGPDVEIYQANVMDRRAIGFDYPPMFCDVLRINHLAFSVFPKTENDPTPHFQNGARDIFVETLLALAHWFPQSLRSWNFGDLYRIFQKKSLLKAILSTTASGKLLSDQHLGKTRSEKDVYSTLKTNLASWRAFALADSMCVFRINLDEFFRSGRKVIVMGMDDSIRSSLLPIYQLASKLMVERGLAANDGRMSIFDLDEIVLMESIDWLTAVLKGRSSLVSVVASCQDFNVLAAAYKPDKARGFLSCFQSKVFLRQGSLESARYASGEIGMERGIQRGFAYKANRLNPNVNETETERPLVSPADLQNLPLACPKKNRVEFYLKSPAYDGIVHARSPFVKAVDGLANPEIPAYLPRDLSGLDFPSFTIADVRELGIPLTDDLRAALA